MIVSTALCLPFSFNISPVCTSILFSLLSAPFPSRRPHRPAATRAFTVTPFFVWDRSCWRRHQQCSSRKLGDHGALPPCPKSCQKMLKIWEIYWQNLRNTAGVSVHWFDATNDKKHVYHLINTPFVSMHADQLPMEQEDIYKYNKEWFVSL
jgi:hypothetical protein